jgi:hypothetical protein
MQKCMRRARYQRERNVGKRQGKIVELLEWGVTIQRFIFRRRRHKVELPDGMCYRQKPWLR